jgi:hypothetical protein
LLIHIRSNPEDRARVQEIVIGVTIGRSPISIGLDIIDPPITFPYNSGPLRVRSGVIGDYKRGSIGLSTP